jgi:RNA polymerase sigma factor (sigma-70 family)
MSMLSEPPDEDETRFMVARAQAGDERALEDLFRRHHDHLLLSVALDAFRDLDNFVPREPGSFRHYLNKLVLDRICDRARYFDAAKRRGGERASQNQLKELPAKDSQGSYFDASGRFERLEREIQRLPEDMRQVLILRSVDGLPSQEVAKMLDKSDAAVRKSYSRAVAHLATHLGDEEPA